MIHLNSYQQQSLNNELLKYSSKRSSLQKMRQLIFQGADVNYQNKSGKTALMEAVQKQFYSGVKLLLDNHVTVDTINAVDDIGYTAINKLIAISNYNFEKSGSKKIIDLLIESGADLRIGVDVLGGRYILARDYISEKYPEQYEEYLIKKNSETYNL